MTTKELKSKIADATDVNWFNNVEETFAFPHLNISVQLKGLTSIYEYVNQQIAGWQNIEGPNEFDISKNHFISIKNSILSFVTQHISQPGINLTGYWRGIKNLINNHQPKLLTFDSPQTGFLIRINKEQPSYFRGAFNFLLDTNEYNINNKDFFYGAIMAYEFTFKDKSQLTERINAEKKSLTTLKNEFLKYISQADTQLTEHLYKANISFKEYTKSIDELKNTKNEAFNNWFTKTKEDDWNNWYEPTKTKIKELEKAYQEKLKLEEPAKYWAERAKKLKLQGWFALIVLVLLIGITSWSLGKILWTAPDQLYLSWLGEDKSSAIRWSIVYITLISFIAFCVRAITKVMFSSFHLSRDCEERHTLTYFYLALLKDSRVDENDRQLIMQSLFSRAETGLLKDDSSPTMPSDTLTKMTGKS